MYLAKEGRKDYLDFVKNIPIQALFFFMATLFFHGGLSGRPRVETTVIGVMLLLMGGGAALASTSLLVESLRKHLVEPERARALQHYPPIHGGLKARARQFRKRWWLRRRVLVEVFIVLMVMNFAFSVAVISGLSSALSTLHVHISNPH